MRKAAPVIAAVAVLAALGVWLLLPSYRYACFVFVGPPRLPSQDAFGISLRGKGDPEGCSLLLDPPGVYIGPSIDIPEGATVFGTLTVTDGLRIAAIPLHMWESEGGAVEFGCNGPSPRFARKASNPEEFLRAVIGIVADKGAAAASR